MKTKLFNRALGLLAFTGLVLAAAQVHAQVPAGSYTGSCSGASVSNNVLRATCRTGAGAMVATTLQLPCNGTIDNINGQLQCKAAAAAGVPAGSYLQTCAGARVANNILYADCRRANQTVNAAQLRLPCTNVDNQNGNLVCLAGAGTTPVTPPGGGTTTPPPGGGTTPPPGGGGAAPVIDGPALSSPDTAAVMKWIADRVGSERQGYCWRQSYGRGVGTIPSDCSPKENDAGLCYDRCKAGYGQAGPVCWGYCPSGYSDHGVGCGKPSAYGRGAGYPWKFGDGLNDNGMYSRCRASNPQGCEKNGAIVYPKCKAGFHAVGCCICSPDCPSGFSDTGATCLKPSYGRGAGTIPTNCGAKQNDAGLCYPGCKAGYAGVGPVCWGNCPAGKVNCGAGCAASSFGCAADTANMVLAPAILVVNIVTAGSASAGTSFASQMATKYKSVIDAAKVAMTAKDVVNASYQVGKTTALWVNDYVGTFAQMTNKQVNDEINRRFSARGAKWVKEQFAMNSLTLMMKADGIETAQNILNAASGFDPTGVTGVVSAYAKPVCSTDDPFPTVSAKY